MRFICNAQRHTSLSDMRGLLQDVLVQKNGMQFVNFAKFHDSLPNSSGDSMENRGIFYVPSLQNGDSQSCHCMCLEFYHKPRTAGKVTVAQSP